jgi:hypothetical protein
MPSGDTCKLRYEFFFVRLQVLTVVVVLELSACWVDMLSQLVNISWSFKLLYCLCPLKC